MTVGLRLELGLAGLRREQVAPALQRLVHADQLAHARQVVRVELHDLRQHGDERRVALDVVAVDRRRSRAAPPAALRRRPAASFSSSCRSRSVSAFHPPVCRYRRLSASRASLLLGSCRRSVRHCSMAFCALAPSSASFAISAPIAERSGPSGSARCASVSTVARRVVSPRAVHSSRKKPSIPGWAGSSLRKPLEPRLGGLGPVAHAPVHHRDLQDGAELLFLAAQRAGRQLPLVEGHEVLPLLLRGEVVREEARGLGVTGTRSMTLSYTSAARSGCCSFARSTRARRRSAASFSSFCVASPAKRDSALVRSSQRPSARRTRSSSSSPRRFFASSSSASRSSGSTRASDPSSRPEPVGDLGRAHEQRAAETRVAPAVRLLHVAFDQVAPLPRLASLRSIASSALASPGRSSRSRT